MFLRLLASDFEYVIQSIKSLTVLAFQSTLLDINAQEILILS